MKHAILVFLMLLLLPACSHEEWVLGQERIASQQKIVFLPSGLRVIAEKADSEEKRQKGLMGRKSLTDHEGMIFYFDHTAIHAFWMFNTLIPLAVVFVNEDLVVVDIQCMDPCLSLKSEGCPVYVARQPSRFAVEINQDTARKYRIGVGNRIRFEDR